ncbi:putative Gnk2-like domain-containing protein [Helianthus annuus]|nr:putative Gnk2-like domain-containing protein [Helianthus annuus]
MKKPTHKPISLISLIVMSLLVSKSNADARSELIKLNCDDKLEADQTIFVQNFILLMEIVGTQIRSSHNATASVGKEPNKNIGLAQCYGDLSSQDCILCYAEIRTIFPTCFPHNGGRVYLDVRLLYAKPRL